MRSANWRKEHKVKKTHQDVDHRDDYDHDHGDDDHDYDHGDVNVGLFPYICTLFHIWKRRHMEFWVPIMVMVMVIMEIILMMIYDRMAVDKKRARRQSDEL